MKKGDFYGNEKRRKNGSARVRKTRAQLGAGLARLIRAEKYSKKSR